jgi:hypothetical protein
MAISKTTQFHNGNAFPHPQVRLPDLAWKWRGNILWNAV